MWNNKPRTTARKSGRRRGRILKFPGELLLPGALLVTIQTQLLAAFVFVDFRLTAFFD
jgi:hypothetical protein